MLADGWRNPILFARSCGSKTYLCAKRVAKQTQTELMEQVAVPTGVQSSGKSGVSLLQQLPARNICMLSWAQITQITLWDSTGGSRRRCGTVSDSADVCECGRKAVSQVAGWESPTHLSVCSSAAASLQRWCGTPVRERGGSARASSWYRLLRTSVIQRIILLNLLLN